MVSSDGWLVLLREALIETGSRAIDFATGLSINERLKEQFAGALEEARLKYKRTGRDVRMFASEFYQATSWSRTRRVICRVLVTANGEDMRFVFTSFGKTGAKYLYETVYCGCGAMELMIKDHKNGLCSDRTSCDRFTANQFRLFLHSGACGSKGHNLRMHSSIRSVCGC